MYNFQPLEFADVFFFAASEETSPFIRIVAVFFTGYYLVRMNHEGRTVTCIKILSRSIGGWTKRIL